MATITEVDAAVKPAKIALMEATELPQGHGFHSTVEENGVTIETTIVRTGETTLDVIQTVDGAVNEEGTGEFDFGDVARLAGEGLLYGVPREQIPLTDEFFTTHLDQEDLAFVTMVSGYAFGAAEEG